jgi:hypothetical protein
MGLEATFCLSPGIYATPQDFWSQEQEYEVPLRHRCTMTLHYIRAPSRCPDIDPEYAVRTLWEHNSGVHSVGTWAGSWSHRY